LVLDEVKTKKSLLEINDKIFTLVMSNNHSKAILYLKNSIKNSLKVEYKDNIISKIDEIFRKIS